MDELCELPNSADGWYCSKCGFSGGWGEDHEMKEYDAPCPSPTRDPAAFLALLNWHAKEGREPNIEARIQDPVVINEDHWWCATLWIEVGHFLCENGPNPMVALAMATSAWAKRKGGA